MSIDVVFMQLRTHINLSWERRDQSSNSIPLHKLVFLLRGEADPVFIDVMESGAQLDWREALEKVREACPDAHHRVLLEPMAPGMVRDAVIGDESGEKECVYRHCTGWSK